MSRYRKAALFTGVAALVLVFALGFIALDDSEDPVVLGVGRAGVMTPEEARIADSLRVADSLRAVDSVRTARARQAEADRARVEQEAAAQAAPGQPAGAGEASYYGSEFEGRRTASGEPYRGAVLTAAHRTLPFGTRLRVTNLRTGKAVIVRVNDRGPFAGNRVIDLSRTAAQRLGMIASGTARVKLEVLR